MPLALARYLVAALGVYAGIGVVFAVAFVTRGAGRIDPSAQGAPLGFRLLIFPGAAALWPYLLRRWVSGATEPPTERNAHRAAAARGGR